MCNNTIIRAVLLLSLIFSLYACAQNTGNKKQQAGRGNKNNAPKEIWTIYDRQDTLVHVKRLMNTDSGLTLFTYDINSADPIATRQVSVNSKKLSGDSEAASAKAQSTNYQWIPYKPATVLFIQVEPSGFKDEMEALNRRHEIEDKIDEALKAKGFGEWIAGDLGPGGLNMLYAVPDIDQATPVMLDILAKNRLDKKAIIARQLDVAKDDWFYEIIYPLNFTGVFLSF